MEINEITEARGNIYGDFRVQFELAQTLKNSCKIYTNYTILNPVQKECLDMILHKISRIIVGDPFYLDNWVDIQGYASLAEKEIRQINQEEQVI